MPNPGALARKVHKDRREALMIMRSFADSGVDYDAWCRTHSDAHMRLTVIANRLKKIEEMVWLLEFPLPKERDIVDAEP